MNTHTLTLTRFFKAPRERVFEAFTQVDALMAWFGPKGLTVPRAELDVRVGGRYRLEMHGQEEIHVLSGEYREIVRPEKLVFTWVWGQGDMAQVETLVTISLSEAASGTELRLIHAGLPSTDMLDAHSRGWTSSWDCLEEALAGQPSPS